MLRVRDLPVEAARSAIRDGEFPSEIFNSPNIAVVMTQNWCPDWLRMRSWLRGMERSREPDEMDVDVYVFIYNKVDFFSAFMEFKEQTFGNRLIPYVRYYVDGQFVGDSNQQSSNRFLGHFRRSSGDR